MQGKLHGGRLVDQVDIFIGHALQMVTGPGAFQVRVRVSLFGRHQDQQPFGPEGQST